MTKIIIIYILLILLLFISSILYIDTFGNSSSYTGKQNYAFIKKPDERNSDTMKDGIDLIFDDYNNQHNYNDLQRINDLYAQKRTTYNLTSNDADDYYNPNYDENKNNKSSSNNIINSSSNLSDDSSDNLWLFIIFSIMYIIIIIFIFILLMINNYIII